MLLAGISFLVLNLQIQDNLYFSTAAVFLGSALVPTTLQAMTIWVIFPKILNRFFPQLSILIEWISNWFSHILALTIGSEITLGSTFLGVQQLWLCVFFIAISIRKINYLVAALGGFMVIWTSAIVYANALADPWLAVLINAFKVNVGISVLGLGLGQIASYFPLCGFGVAAIMFALAVNKMQLGSFLPSVRIISKRQLIVSALIGGCLYLIPWLRYINVVNDNARICFVDSKWINFHSPAFDTKGVANSGMFGLLERALVSSGYSVSHVSKAVELDAEKCDVAIIINPDTVSADDQIAFDRFLSSGKSALVLGDHTDLGGIKGTLDRLLGRYGASFRFDSAFPVSASWDWKFSSLLHPFTSHLGTSNERLQQGTGASIALQSLDWLPIISGNYVFSDAGNRLNKADAYLGNYQYEPGELLGNLPILVEKTFSKGGHLIVFGDTSAFQNLAIAHSWPFIISVIRYCTGSAVVPQWVVVIFSGLGSFIFLAAVFRMNSANNVFISIGLIASMMGSQIIAKHSKIYYPKGDLVAFDLYTPSKITLDHWRDRSIDGAIINCFRNGTWPILQYSSLPIENTKIMFIISPVAVISQSRSKQILERVSNGMALVLGIGGESATFCRNILSPLNCQVKDIPLGPVPIRGSSSGNDFLLARFQPQFSKAAPIITNDTEWKDIYSWNGYSIIAQRRYGLGKIVIIADDQFLWDKTLEAEKDGWQGNINLLSRIISGDFDE